MNTLYTAIAVWAFLHAYVIYLLTHKPIVNLPRRSKR